MFTASQMSDWFCLAPSDFIAVFLLLNTCFGEDSVFITSLNYVEKVHFLQPLDICTVILQIHGNLACSKKHCAFYRIMDSAITRQCMSTAVAIFKITIVMWQN